MFILRSSPSIINSYSRRFVQNLPNYVQLELDQDVNEQLKSDNRKLAYFKEHKGKFSYKVDLPKNLELTINTILSDIEPQRLKIDMKLLTDHIAERHLPIEQPELQTIARNVIGNFQKSQPPINTLSLSPEEREKLNLEQKYALIKRLKSSIYHWQPLAFNEYRSKVYLAACFARHYAMLTQIFNEIKKREKDFRPTHLLDFGSGTGSAMWAALRVWGKKGFAEILNVDKSRDMNNLSQLILQGGQGHKSPAIQGVVYRQFAPHGRENTFDLVVSDHSLFELENHFERFKTVQSLWYNVKPGGFLIIVEEGNIHGYQAINEARENLLNRIAVFDKKPNESNEESSNKDEDDNDDDIPLNKRYSPAFIYSPCPHDLVCPKKQLNKPCRISTRYRPLQIFDVQQHSPDYTTGQMSYIVVRKAERKKDDVYGTWPRVIEPILDRKNHQHVRLCCPNGEYVNVPVSKNKHGIGLHRLSHHAEPGDLFPVINKLNEEKLEKSEQEKISSQQRKRRAYRT